MTGESVPYGERGTRRRWRLHRSGLGSPLDDAGATFAGYLPPLVDHVRERADAIARYEDARATVR